jgi:dihydrodipicolinate reductase
MEQVKMRAAVLGATGLVGKNIVKLLIDDDRFSHVSAIVRRSVEIKNDKLLRLWLILINWKPMSTGLKEI